MIIYFLLERSGFVIIVGMYLLPILLFYGLPSSILSDVVTEKLKGAIRGISALLIHLFLAALFVLIPIILFDEFERNLLFSDIKSLLENFFFITAILSSSLFWCIDEFLRCTRTKDTWNVLVEKIGDLRI
jgi:glucan phosphoethanolaminetransferase (alkaline phosphatase superfamily)